MSCIRAFLTLDFSLSCFTPNERKMKNVGVRKYPSS
jgi:hypothetical protein